MLVVVQDETRGYDFFSTELHPSDFCRIAMELEELIRVQFLQKYATKKPDPGGA